MTTEIKTPREGRFDLLRAGDGCRKARLLTVGGVGLDDPALLRLVDCLVSGREKLLRSGDILLGECLGEELGRVPKGVLAAQVKDVLTRRGAHCLLC